MKRYQKYEPTAHGGGEFAAATSFSPVSAGAREGTGLSLPARGAVHLLLCLPARQKDPAYGAGGLGTGGGRVDAFTSDWKPIFRWLPSQKGLFSEAPQRQRLMVVRPARSYGFPSASHNVRSPSKRRDPSFLTVILANVFFPPHVRLTVATAVEDEV